MSQIPKKLRYLKHHPHDHNENLREQFATTWNVHMLTQCASTYVLRKSIPNYQEFTVLTSRSAPCPKFLRIYSTHLKVRSVPQIPENLRYSPQGQLHAPNYQEFTVLTSRSAPCPKFLRIYSPHLKVRSVPQISENLQSSPQGPLCAPNS